MRNLYANVSRETFAQVNRPSLAQPVETAFRHARVSRETLGEK